MIQLVLEFQLEKPELPVEYERTIVSFLKRQQVIIIHRKCLKDYI